MVAASKFSISMGEWSHVGVPLGSSNASLLGMVLWAKKNWLFPTPTILIPPWCQCFRIGFVSYFILIYFYFNPQRIQYLC